MIKTAKMQGNVMVSAVGREPTLRSNMLGADLRSLEFPGDVGDVVGVHTPQELEPEGAKDPVSVCKWEVGGLAVTVFCGMWLCCFGHRLLSCLCVLSFKHIPRAVLGQAERWEIALDKKYPWALMPSPGLLGASKG